MRLLKATLAGVFLCWSMTALAQEVSTTAAEGGDQGFMNHVGVARPNSNPIVIRVNDPAYEKYFEAHRLKLDQNTATSHTGILASDETEEETTTIIYLPAPESDVSAVRNTGQQFVFQETTQHQNASHTAGIPEQQTDDAVLSHNYRSRQVEILRQLAAGKNQQ